MLLVVLCFNIIFCYNFDILFRYITSLILMEQRDSELLNQNKRPVKFSAKGILFPKAAVSTLKHIQVLEWVILERVNVWRAPCRIWSVMFESVLCLRRFEKLFL